MARASLAVLILVGATGCSVPARDNPNDPTIRTEARLRVVDHTDAGGTCGAVPGDWPTVVDASRGRCLSLDASGSSDPVGSARFTFAVQGSGLDVTLVESVESPVLDLRALPVALPVDELLTFSVRVRNHKGGDSSATAVLALRNARPVLPSPPARRLALRGTGETLTLTFDASGATDPDGDPLWFCWTFPGEAEVCAADDAVRTREVPGNVPVRIAPRVRVLDGDPVAGNPDDLSSLQAAILVEVGEPAGWIEQTYATFTQVHRVAPPTELLVGPFSDGAPHAVAIERADGTALVVHAFQSNVGFRVFAGAVDPATGAIGPTVQIGGVNSEILALAPFGEEAVALVTQVAPELKRITAAPGNPPTVTVGATIPGFEALTGAPLHLVEDGAGNLWGADREVVVVSAGGQSAEPFSIPSGGRIAGLAARPGTNEVWLVREASGALPTGQIEVYVHPSAAPVRVLPYGGAHAAGLAFADAAFLWTWAEGLGLVLVDATRLSEGLPFDAAIVAAFPTVSAYDGSRLVADPVSGAAAFLGTDLLSGTFQIAIAAPSGGLRSMSFDADESDRPVPRFFDDDGRVWFAGNFNLTGAVLRPGTPALSGTLEAHAFFTQGPVLYDVGTGGVWVSTQSPAASLERIHPDGSRETHSLLSQDEALVGAPTLSRAAITPDGAELWGIAVDGSGAADRVVAVHLEDSPPALEDIASAQDLIFLFGAAGPAGDRFSWAYATAGQIRRVSAAGSVNAFTLPSAEQIAEPKAARSPSSGRLCLATLESGARMRMRRLAVGTLEDFGSVERLTGTSLLSAAAAASSHEGVDLCWFALGDRVSPLSDSRLTLEAWSGAGELVHRHVLTGPDAAAFGITISPVTADRVLLSYGVTLDAVTLESRHDLTWFTFTPGVVNTATLFTLQDPIGAPFELVGPR